MAEEQIVCDTSPVRVEIIPIQAVHDPSSTPVTSSMVAAHEVQTRFVVGVQGVDSYSVERQAEAHSEHFKPHTSYSHLYSEVWKPGAHVAAVHKSEVLPIQAVQDPSRILATEFMISAHEVQTRFGQYVPTVVVGERACTSAIEQGCVVWCHPGLLVQGVASQGADSYSVEEQEVH